MKPSVMANANAGGNANASAHAHASNGVTIPINHEYPSHMPQQHPQQQYADASTAAYGSPRQHQQQMPQHYQQQQQHPQQQTQHGQQIPAHFQQGYGFEPDMDMDMDMDIFPRSRLAGRMHHDPFAGFGGSHFNFPQFGSMGRRRPAADSMQDDDFFNRLPSEFRQYIPEGFATTRRGMPAQHQQHQQHQQHPQPQPQAQVPSQYYQQAAATNQNIAPQSPSKKLCDAAIQTEDPTGGSGYSEVDHAAPMQTDNLNQHGLRNTVDLGIKSMPENEQQGLRSHSAPPPEQLLQQQQQQQQQHQIPINGRRVTPPQQSGFGTQTSPQVHNQGIPPQSPLYQKAYYPPQQQTHPQQKQQTPPPPQTPGGTYVRTIPIFVEGRSEPIINAHKEIPNQNAPSSPAAAQASARAQSQQQQQQPHHRPSPLNTQQQAAGPSQQQSAAAGVPPQTPHTVDSINKIQDIQRDVLDLMSKVEQFKGRRHDKEYVYLDEMLTRNLLKLDTIDTNGKESIRLARKEAIKCIQASINVLEAKAEENAKTAKQAESTAAPTDEIPTAEVAKSSSQETAAAAPQDTTEEANKKQEAIPLPPAHPTDATLIHEPIPLPAPEDHAVAKHKSPSPAKETNANVTVEKSASSSSQK